MIHFCHAVDCNVKVPPQKLMCLFHWNLVPKNIQKKIYDNYRKGQCEDKRPSLEYVRLARLAIDIVKEIEK